MHLVEAFGMSPFLIEKKPLVGAAFFLGLDVKPALKKPTANKRRRSKKTFSGFLDY